LLIDLESLGVSRAAWPLVGIAAGVAGVDALQPLVPEQAMGIHWPNDIYLAGRKLAGILVEVLGDRLHVVGIGLNTNNSLADAPAELRPTAITLADLTGRRFDHTDLLVALLGRLESCLRQLGRAPQEIAARADALCLQRGRPLRICRGQRRFNGCCRGIAADGGLLLETPEGTEKFFSGVIGGP
jgi:BirA family biotin operon repressor/biotin-[acetyl-CoA-carboxylase] ligase